MESKSTSFSSFEEFWPFYVSQHSKRGNRAFHFAGTTAGIVSVAGAIAQRRPVLFVWGLVLGYGLSWIGHYAIEKNRPATFGHPFWSLASDFRMYGLMWRGKMTEEARRLNRAENTRVFAREAIS
jgi:hypothetical protein